MPRKVARGAAGAVTLHDVARRAGVSLATASRALNGSKDRTVGQALQERVRAAAQELGYSANPTAQAMARGRTDVVGLVVQDIDDPYFSAIAAGVMREAQQRDLLVTLASTQGRHGVEVDHVATLRGQWARVVIVVGSRSTDRAEQDRLADELAAFEASGGRAVAVSQPLLPIDTIELDNRGGAFELARGLHAQGYRRFAVLGGPPDLLTAIDRLAGFGEGLQRCGAPLREGDVEPGEFTRDGGYAAMGRLLDRGTDASCVFAVNDVMAVGAMAALRERGVPLPEGMAVAGFDDIAMLRDVTPALTSVHVDLDGVGRAALRMALAAGDGRPRVESFGASVVVRASTPALATLA